MATIMIRATRAFYLHGLDVPAGVAVQADPVDAAAVVATGRAVYVDPADREVAAAAVRLADQQADTAAGKSRPSYWSRSRGWR